MNTNTTNTQIAIVEGDTLQVGFYEAVYLLMQGNYLHLSSDDKKKTTFNFHSEKITQIELQEFKDNKELQEYVKAIEKLKAMMRKRNKIILRNKKRQTNNHQAYIQGENDESI